MRRRNRRQKETAVEPALNAEQLAYQEAREIAKRRVKFFGHAVIWGMSILFLIVTAGFGSAIVIGLGWGIFLATQGYYALIAPELQKKWVEDEIRWRLERGLDEERQAIQSKHARSLEELSASIAHEIRNPITAAKSLVQQMGEDPVAQDNVEFGKVALEELDRVERSISHLLRYARDEELAVSQIQVDTIVESALETFRDRLGDGAVRVERDLAPNTSIRADPEKLRRIIINLVGNALDVLSEQDHDAEPCLRISSGMNLANTEFWLRLKDNGPGIEDARLAKIFSPFHTSKANGTGLGLAISKKMVEAHGGTIEVMSEAGSGTEFIVTLPQRAAEPA
jgi:signal transduction histidine kinase